MAFSFVVEDGTGLDNATSYVSVANADDYFAVDLNAAGWTALTTEQKELQLGWATRFLDQKTTWKGSPATTVQALRWPRTGTYDRDGVAIGGSVVPDEVAAATCELARWLLTNNPSAGQDVEYLRRVVVDVVEVEYQENTTQTAYPSILNAILTGLGSFTVGRAQFSRIARA